VYRNVKINVYGDGKLLLSKKRPRVAPSEMEAIKISKDLLENVTEIKICLEEIQ
jgi:hypothetical protein